MLTGGCFPVAVSGLAVDTRGRGVCEAGRCYDSDLLVVSFLHHIGEPEERNGGGGGGITVRH